MSLPFRTIVVPTDLSEMSATAAPYAAGLAKAFGSRVICIHVVDDAYLYWGAMGPEGIPAGPPMKEIIDSARQRMHVFVDQHFASMDHRPIYEIRSGRPFSEIIAFSKEMNADLIVMSTHGRGAIAHALLGSTTEKVVRKSSCAVLTIRSPDHSFVLP